MTYFGIFIRLLNVWISLPLILVTSYRALYLLLVCYVQLWCDGSVSFYFVTLQKKPAHIPLCSLLLTLVLICSHFTINSMPSCFILTLSLSPWYWGETFKVLYLYQHIKYQKFFFKFYLIMYRISTNKVVIIKHDHLRAARWTNMLSIVLNSLISVITSISVGMDNRLSFSTAWTCTKGALSYFVTSLFQGTS